MFINVFILYSPLYNFIVVLSRLTEYLQIVDQLLAYRKFLRIVTDSDDSWNKQCA